MIKVFNGGYEIAKEYYFQYDGNEEVYDSSTRIITGSLVVKDNTELETMDMLKNVIDSFLVIIEPMQVGYMLNLLQVRDIAFSNKMATGDVVYTITGSKKMKPKKVNNYKVVKLSSDIGNYFRNFEVSTLTSFTLDEIVRPGYFRTEDGTDIRYFWVSDEPVDSLQYEIGHCRLQTGENFYVTQTGGTNIKMQMPSKSGIPFPNNRVKFVAASGTAPALVKGQRLEVN